MVSIPDIKEHGPHQRVTPTRGDGKANAEAAPQYVAPTDADAVRASLRADFNTEILVELRTQTRVLALGLNVADSDVDALRDDERARVGF